ncbi:GNAT family N-acetyltransferase [Thermoplasma acidophilum]|uniref:GNAT family N-acetyltransferase n=1 Tax=Thermoplasma acidophilum TaxID=2303 RepID=UPI00064F0207|nr:GNAT family N-acetyltransferase [Thermoplasma acidophilum]
MVSKVTASDNVSVVPAAQSDLNDILSLLLRLKRFNSEFGCYCIVSEDDPEEIKRYTSSIIDDGKHIILLAKDRGKTVGLILADVLYRIYYSPKYEARIRDIYVLPEYRMRGIGQKLIEELMNVASKRNIGLVTTEFPSDNLVAVNFFSKIGYSQMVSIWGVPVQQSLEP